MPTGTLDCPHCFAPAPWVDRLFALDFALRRFHLASLEATVEKPQFRQIVENCRLRREAMVEAAQSRGDPPTDPELPPPTLCWNCRKDCPPNARRCAGCGVALDSPEVRLGRYLSFLRGEIARQQQAGHLRPPQAARLLADVDASLQDLRTRLGG
jgi:hypothetical protein